MQFAHVIYIHSLGVICCGHSYWLMRLEKQLLAKIYALQKV